MVSNLKAEQLTSWDPWSWRRIEQKELKGELPQGLQLNARPFAISGLEKKKEAGLQNSKTLVEVSTSTSYPSLRSRRGAWITRGTNLKIQIESGWVSDHVSFWFEPRAIYSENKNPVEDFPENHSTVKAVDQTPEKKQSYKVTEWSRANLLFHLQNLLLQAGYDSLRFGSGTRATLHWDIHAPPMPLLRIGTRSPWNTSWGYWTFSHHVAQLEKDRYVPHSRLSGWRLGWSTESRLELGLSRSWQVGWVSGEQFQFYSLVGELYDPRRFFKKKPDFDNPDEDYSGGDYRNQQLVMDGRLKFPETGTRIYWEWGREDHEHDISGIQNRWQHSQAKVLGLHQQYGSEREWYSNIEWADTLQPESLLHWGNTIWYNHHLYKSGWTYKGVLLGHPMGADAEMSSFTFGRMSPSLGWQFCLEEQNRGVRGAEISDSSKVRVETQRLLEFDMEHKMGPDQWRLFMSSGKLLNPGRIIGPKLENQTLIFSWNRNW